MKEGNKKRRNCETWNYVMELIGYFDKAIGIFYILITSFKICLGSKAIVKHILHDQWAENKG
jgi:hypothetical protein